MIHSFNYLSFLFVTAALCLVVVVVFIYQRREIPGAKAFLAVLVAGILWAGGEALGMISADLELKLWFKKIAYLGIVSLPGAWLIFALQYFERTRFLKRATWVSLGCIPVLSLVLIWTTEYHTLFFRKFAFETIGQLTVFARTPGLFYWIFLFYAYITFVIGALVFLSSMFRLKHLYPNYRIALVLVGVCLPALANILFNFRVPPGFFLDATPLVLPLSTALIGQGLFRLRYSGLVLTARDRVIENMSDPILVVDREQRVVDLNPAFARVIERPADQLIGQPLELILASWPSLAEQLKLETELHTEIVLEQGGRSIDFELSLSPLVRGSQVIGKLILLRDVSAVRKTAASLAQSVAEEARQREIAQGLRESMMSLISTLDLETILGEILAQLKRVIPYYSAALYLAEGSYLNLRHVVGPSSLTAKSYSTPRRQEQVDAVFQMRQAAIFESAHAQRAHDQSGFSEPSYESMAAPLIVGLEALGVLTIDRFERLPFHREDLEILQAFTNQAALVLKNAELYSDAQVAAALEERNRLAQEFHDAVNQNLFTASILAEAIPKIWETDPERARQGLEEVRSLTRSALAEMRTLLMELRSKSLTEKPLGELLGHLVRALSARIRIPVNLQIAHDAILPEVVQVTFYRIAQEALHNIIKHAQATRVDITLQAQTSAARMVIQDNGRGFDIAQVGTGSFGLEIMQERAVRIGAELRLASQADQGTRISLDWSANRDVS